MLKITTPLEKENLINLKAGDSVLISGTIYTARDAAHKKLIELLNQGKKLPINIKNQIIYYVGPTPTKPGHAFGSAGPTTSGRMDAYTPRLIELGLTGMIGKGLRNQDVKNAIVKHKSIYFGAIGGTAAIISKSIKSSKVIAFEELGPEALRELVVKNFPAVVIIDSKGNNLYEIGRKKYLELQNK